MTHPAHHAQPISRRLFLKQAFAATAVTVSPRLPDHGIVKPPCPLPAISVRRSNGASGGLQAITSGRATALQLMFTRCTTTCPMQGAIFERVQKLLPNLAGRNLQLLSLSIDPANDTPQALTEWLGIFHAGPAWLAAAPSARDLPALKSFFGAANSPLDPHSTQVHLLNREGNLVFRTGELPPPEQIAAILSRL